MPSYTFVINGRCILLLRCKDRICGYQTDTMNIDEKLIEQAITDKTRAIVRWRARQEKL